MKCYTTKEVAEIYSIKPFTVRAWVNSGKLKAMRPNFKRNGSNRMLIAKEDLREFAMNSTREGKVGMQD